jgi:hypothetical protein
LSKLSWRTWIKVESVEKPQNLQLCDQSSLVSS